MDILDLMDRDLENLLVYLELFTYNMTSLLDISNNIWANTRYKYLISKIRQDIVKKEVCHVFDTKLSWPGPMSSIWADTRSSHTNSAARVWCDYLEPSKPLFLAKIFKEEKNDDLQEQNLDTVILLNPQNEEAIYLLVTLKIKQSDYNRAKELIDEFILVCKSFCSKKEEIESKFKKLNPENEKSNN